MSSDQKSSHVTTQNYHALQTQRSHTPFCGELLDFTENTEVSYDNRTIRRIGRTAWSATNPPQPDHRGLHDDQQNYEELLHKTKTRRPPVTCGTGTSRSGPRDTTSAYDWRQRMRGNHRNNRLVIHSSFQLHQDSIVALILVV